MGQFIETKMRMIDKSWQSADADLIASVALTPEQEEELIRANTIKNDRSGSGERNQQDSESVSK